MRRQEGMRLVDQEILAERDMHQGHRAVVADIQAGLGSQVERDTRAGQGIQVVEGSQVELQGILAEQGSREVAVQT